MCKRAKFTEITAANIRWKLLAELGLILLRMVELFKAVVRVRAGVAKWASAITMLTWLGRIRAKWASSVLLMIVDAFLHVVPTEHLTRLCLEYVKIKKSDAL